MLAAPRQGLAPKRVNVLRVWFLGRLTPLARAVLAVLLLFGPAEILYVWCRLNPRPYDGELVPRYGMLISGGALDAFEGEA